MKKLVVLFAIILASIGLVPAVEGCQQQPQTAATPSFAIMAESNIVEAGSSFVVSGSNFKPHQKVWVDIEWRVSDGGEGIQAYCEADENGSIHPVIDVPQDVVLGDYEIEVFTGKNIHDRELLATLPISIR